MLRDNLARKGRSTNTHYRHTQVGWAILGFMAAVIAVVWATLPATAPRPARFPLLLVVALGVLVFAALTVEVDGLAVRLRFGLGLVRKRIPLHDVRGWREVRNPWYVGFGIRLFPGGVLWNVSGLDAVELDLANGRRFRIGTDEPAALASAIARAKGGPPALPVDLDTSEEARTGLPGKLGLLVLLVGSALVGVLFWSQIRPARVSVGTEGIRVDTLFYGADVASADITSVSLETRLPRVLEKTNGFDGAGTLRGRFRLEDLGEGRLYVEEGFAPFVLVRLRQGFLVVNFREPEKTRALYDQMACAWPDRVVRRVDVN
jgi:hypothetical protein